MDANSGEPWSEMDSSDLKNESNTAGRLQRPQASFAGTCTKSARKELRLTEQPSKRRVGFYNNRTPDSSAR